MNGKSHQPYDIDAERTLLGSIINEPSALLKIQDAIAPFDFYAPKHQKTYECLRELQRLNEPIERKSVIEALRKDNFPNPAEFVNDLIKDGISTNIEYYSRLIKDKAIKRRLMRVANRIITLCSTDKDDAKEILAKAEGEIFRINIETQERDYAHVKNGLMELEEILINGKVENFGIKTYFRDIDKACGLLTNDSLVAIAGTTGIGKTSFIYSLILRFVENTKRPVFLWSGEMDTLETRLKLVCMRGRLDSTKVVANQLNSSEKNIFRMAKSELETMPIYIDTTGGITFDELRSKLLRFKLECPDLGFVVIDNLPIMNMKGADKEDAIRQTMVNIRSFSKIIHVPFFILVQYSYNYRASQNRKPENDDILGSSSIIQNCTNVWHLYRSGNDPKDTMRLKLGKQRYSPKVDIKLRWDARTTRFSDY